MKKLASAKTRTILETADTIREGGQWRQIVVEAHPTYAVLRAKGLRRTYPLEWSAIYCFAVKLAAERARAERLAAKKGKRK